MNGEKKNRVYTQLSNDIKSSPEEIPTLPKVEMINLINVWLRSAFLAPIFIDPNNRKKVNKYNGLFDDIIPLPEGGYVKSHVNSKDAIAQIVNWVRSNGNKFELTLYDLIVSLMVTYVKGIRNIEYNTLIILVTLHLENNLAKFISSKEGFELQGIRDIFPDPGDPNFLRVVKRTLTIQFANILREIRIDYEITDSTLSLSTREPNSQLPNTNKPVRLNILTRLDDSNGGRVIINPLICYPLRQLLTQKSNELNVEINREIEKIFLEKFNSISELLGSGYLSGKKDNNGYYITPSMILPNSLLNDEVEITIEEEVIAYPNVEYSNTSISTSIGTILNLRENESITISFEDQKLILTIHKSDSKNEVDKRQVIIDSKEIDLPYTDRLTQIRLLKVLSELTKKTTKQSISTENQDPNISKIDLITSIAVTQYCNEISEVISETAKEKGMVNATDTLFLEKYGYFEMSPRIIKEIKNILQGFLNRMYYGFEESELELIGNYVTNQVIIGFVETMSNHTSFEGENETPQLHAPTNYGLQFNINGLSSVDTQNLKDGLKRIGKVVVQNSNKAIKELFDAFTLFYKKVKERDELRKEGERLRAIGEFFTYLNLQLTSQLPGAIELFHAYCNESGIQLDNSRLDSIEYILSLYQQIAEYYCTKSQEIQDRI